MSESNAANGGPPGVDSPWGGRRPPVPTLFDLSRTGRAGQRWPEPGVPMPSSEELLPKWALREKPARLPEVGEPDVVRHFIALSVRNHHVDMDVYPLGSCTMKYNPKVNDRAAALPGLAHIHPHQADEDVQGALRLVDELSRDLAVVTGMDAVTLQPAAGAQGEMTGLLMARAYHEERGNPRRYVLVPDSAHGTNPASSALVGYETVEVPSGKDGRVDLDALREKLSDEVALVMLTVPNTLGLFETRIREVAEAVHAAGSLLYMDGANMNALLGLCLPGKMGFDILHLNLHKTFSTPHGGGGPGCGAVAVKAALEPYLPVPRVKQEGGRYRWETDHPRSIGRVHGFHGNFGVLVRAYAYVRSLGRDGLRRVSENAILNANYLRARLRDVYDVPFDRPCMHEVVLSGVRQKAAGVKTMDVAKRILDHGFYAPTIYFPLLVPEALMIEPTEVETLDALDRFADCLISIAREAETEPEVVRGAPHTTPVARVDEARAARQPDLAYWAAREGAYRRPARPSPARAGSPA